MYTHSRPTPHIYFTPYESSRPSASERTSGNPLGPPAATPPTPPPPGRPFAGHPAAVNPELSYFKLLNRYEPGFSDRPLSPSPSNDTTYGGEDTLEERTRRG